MIAPLGDEHVAIIEPDDRKRFSLGRHMTKSETAGWKVFASPDGARILLEAVPA